jgi:tetratricopeptide (TPR) repeat protein
MCDNHFHLIYLKLKTLNKIAMNKTLIIFILTFRSVLATAQILPLPPIPPPPPVEPNNKSELNRQDNENSLISKPIQFEIPLDASMDKSSSYYFKKIETLLAQLDSIITPEQIISFTKFKIAQNEVNPSYLDSLATKAYAQIESNDYEKALKTAKILLADCPNSISGHKEASLAYKRLGQDHLSTLHFSMMVKIITSVYKYGDGSYDYPFIINHFFEGVSIYEVAIRCLPRKTALMLDNQNRLLGAYNGCSVILYSELSHWKPTLNGQRYIKESEIKQD